MRHSFLLPILLLAAAPLSAQDTFSIVAVAPATGEVGSAGASCIAVMGFDVANISDLHPGVGVINTQAYYIPANQAYGRTLMARGLPPEEIKDSLILRDAGKQPEFRQYGIVSLLDGGTAVAFTGKSADNYKGHIVRSTFAVQGNILLGHGILDSIATRFERATGSLADRLMFALLGARVPGADTRCMQYGTSSLGAFIRVARPGDRSDSMMLDLRVSIDDGSSEPLDSLERMFASWKVAGIRDESAQGRLVVTPVTSERSVALHIELEHAVQVGVELFDARGERVAKLAPSRLDAGSHVMSLGEMPSGGAYFARVTAGDRVTTCGVVVSD